MKTKSKKSKALSKKTKAQISLVLDGTISVVERKNGKIISKVPIDGELCLRTLIQAVQIGLDILEEKG
jgi:hypothetical protein